MLKLMLMGAGATTRLNLTQRKGGKRDDKPNGRH